MSIQMTSMMDIFTILLTFLLKSFSAEGQIMQIAESIQLPVSTAQEPERYQGKAVYVVPNPATRESIAPWQLMPNNADPTGIKIEFRNLPACRSTVRIFTVSGDLVEVLHHDGSAGDGTLPWDLISRNGQDVASGIYLFAVEPDDARFERTIGKFVVIR